MIDWSRLRPRADWFTVPNLLAAGLFCAAMGAGGGGKPVVPGQIFFLAGLAILLFQRPGEILAWRRWTTSAWCLAAFVGTSLLSVAVNWEVMVHPGDSLSGLRYHFLALILFSQLDRLQPVLGTSWRRDSLIWAWLLPLAFAILVGFLGYALGRHPLRGDDVVDIRRVSGLYGQVMTFAYSLQFSVLILAGFVLVPKAWRAYTRLPWGVALGMFLLSGAALFFTFTRGAVLGVAVGLVYMAFRWSRKMGLTLVLLAAILVAAFLPKAVQELADAKGRNRIPRYMQLHSDLRLSQWRAASLSFLERPVLGWGYRNFEPLSASLKERYGFEKDLVKRRGEPDRVVHFQGHAHNIFLEAFASMGFAGGIALLAFALSWLREACLSRHALFLVPPVLAFIVSGLFENTFYDSEVLNCILLLWVLSQWVIQRERAHSDFGVITTET